MGTSTSSAGAGSGASFDPPWLDDAEAGIDSSHADKPISPNPASEDGSDGANESDPENDNTTPQHVEGPWRRQRVVIRKHEGLSRVSCNLVVDLIYGEVFRVSLKKVWVDQ